MTERVWSASEHVIEIVGGPYRIEFNRLDNTSMVFKAGWTHFGFFPEGPLEIISSSDGKGDLPGGGFFRALGPVRVYGRRGFVISLEGSHGFFQVGGPFADIKRMRYPPGGEQNCLIWPAGPGLATLNYLTMTAAMGWQQPHTHPSLRLNVILSGRAECDSEANGKFEIKQGEVILLNAHERHAFGAAAPTMTFIAFHPDSALSVFDHSPMPANTFQLASNPAHKDLR